MWDKPSCLYAPGGSAQLVTSAGVSLTSSCVCLVSAASEPSLAPQVVLPATDRQRPRRGRAETLQADRRERHGYQRRRRHASVRRPRAAAQTPKQALATRFEPGHRWPPGHVLAARRVSRCYSRSHSAEPTERRGGAADAPRGRLPAARGAAARSPPGAPGQHAAHAAHSTSRTFLRATSPTRSLRAQSSQSLSTTPTTLMASCRL